MTNYLKKNHIPLWVDYRPAIAHSKIHIIDSHIVETGSYNFTDAAEYKNAENLVIVDNAKLASIYTKNWLNRQVVSRKL